MNDQIVSADAAVVATNRDEQTHSMLFAYLLWILGFTGAHRFYYGRPISGVIWLFTFGLVGVGWFIDLFLIPWMDQVAERRYASGRLDYNAAWLLQTFLGVFGLHRIYMGKWGTGILYLVTFGLLGVGVIYDYCTLNRQVDEINRGVV